ncbi:MAG: sulfate transporter ATP-binding protein [Hyphomicrobiales bacterium]|nr:sulfate transporter ATP-binding protein [Hyphomicrobiales bacterium]
MSIALAIETLEKTFGAYPALRGVSLDVAPGELVALLGPSGSGKTTLLRAIAGLEQAEGGRVLFNGIDTRRLTLRERRIGFVFQSYALFRHLDVFENVAFGLRARPRGERPREAQIRTRVAALLELVQLGGLEKRFPSQLSGGQRQRVALARALAIEPQVLLLDEPFGALDAKVRKDLRRWLRELHARTGHTTLFVTHDQEEALELSDRVAILNQGRIEQVGTPDDVYDRPASGFVCEFLGEANRLPVEIVNGEAMFAQRALLGGFGPRPGGPAFLYVRPQHVALTDSDRDGLPGAIVAVRRHGAFKRVEVALEGLSRRLEFDLDAGAAPSLGATVCVRFTQGHVFPAQEGAG